MTTSGRREPRDGDATRALLVETAERLFAERGIGAVSVRQVNKEAGLGAAAVHYHFGSKEVLIETVVQRLGDPVVAGILDGCRRLLAQERHPTARDLVEVWAAPSIDLLADDLSRGARWLTITARLPGDLATRLLGARVGRPWRKVLERAFPKAAPADRARGWTMVGATLPRLLARAPAGMTPAAAAQRAAYIEGCLEFTAHGLAGFMASVAPR